MSLYTQLLGISVDLDSQIAKLELQKTENDILLMREKAMLYSEYALGTINLEKVICVVGSYLNNLKEKKITKATKCDGKTYYAILKDAIKDDTKIDVKDITKVTYNGLYFPKFDIYFTIPGFKKEFFISIPQKDSVCFKPTLHEMMEKTNFSSSSHVYISRDHHLARGIERLSTVLGVVTDESKHCTTQEELSIFPEKVIRLCEFSDVISNYIKKKGEKTRDGDD